MKVFLFFLSLLLLSAELSAGVSIRLRGRIVSYTDTYIKVQSEGKVEIIPLEYVSPVLKNELHRWLNKEVVLRLPEHVLNKKQE